MSLRSKADLQITKSKLADVLQEVKGLERKITDKNMQLEKQKQFTQKLNQEFQKKKEEIN